MKKKPRLPVHLDRIYVMLAAGNHAAVLTSNKKPVRTLLAVLDTLESLALSLLTEEDLEHQHSIHRWCLQSKLGLLTLREGNDPAVGQFYDELWEVGFESEAQLVTCTAMYCHWLRERNRDELANEMYERALRSVENKCHRAELKKYVGMKKSSQE